MRQCTPPREGHAATALGQPAHVAPSTFAIMSAFRFISLVGLLSGIGHADASWNSLSERVTLTNLQNMWKDNPNYATADVVDQLNAAMTEAGIQTVRTMHGCVPNVACGKINVRGVRLSKPRCAAMTCLTATAQLAGEWWCTRVLVAVCFVLAHGVSLSPSPTKYVSSVRVTKNGC